MYPRQIRTHKLSQVLCQTSTRCPSFRICQITLHCTRFGGLTSFYCPGVILSDFKGQAIMFFCSNGNPEASPIAQLEVHKNTLRGHILVISVRLKQTCQAAIHQLLTKVKTLKSIHKKTQASSTLQELLSTRMSLLEALGKKRNGHSCHLKKFSTSGTIRVAGS